MLHKKQVYSYIKPQKKDKINIIFRILIFILALIIPVSQSFAKIDNNTLLFYSKNNILYYDPTGNNNNSCIPSSNIGTWTGNKYNLTESQLRGVLAMAEAENGGSLNGVKSELSLMLNVYEKYTSKPYTPDKFIAYITKPGGWFGTYDKYNKSFQPTYNGELEAAKSIINEGNRTLPPQILEHDMFGDIKKISNDNGATWISSQSKIQNRSNYKEGTTLIVALGDPYIFYAWADPEEKTGDPFGYFPNNPPEQIGTFTSSSEATGYNKNYAGDQVWTEEQLAKIEKNRPIYEEAANEYGFPWQVMAVLHNIEHSLEVSNPSNRQGIYQLYSYTNGGTNSNSFVPAGPVSESEFKRQTKIAAKVASEMAGDLNNPDNVKSLFFQYNGKASQYKQKAINMGFSQEEAENGEGSTYVMNRYDEKRDPTSPNMSTLWPGRFVADGVYDSSSTTTVFGAFVQYVALGGAGTSICQDTEVPGDFSNIISTYAWPDYKGSEFSTPTDKWKTKVQERSSAGKYVGGGVTDCGGWVTFVVQESGLDPNYNSYKGTTGSQEKWVKENWTFLNKNNSTPVDPSILKAGDVAFIDGHTWIYVGEISGFNSNIASASLGHRAAMAGKEPSDRKWRGTEVVRWYRKK